MNADSNTHDHLIQYTDDSSDGNHSRQNDSSAVRLNGKTTATSATKDTSQRRFEINFKKRKSKGKQDLSHLNGYQFNKYKLARGRERRATLTIAIIVAGFMICWVPFSLLYLIDRVCLCGIREHPMFTVIFWMGYCNSGMNPILYSIFNPEFREAFRRLLCRK